MTYAERQIMDTYVGFFEKLPPYHKLELIEKLVKSLKKDRPKQEQDFFKSFGGWDTDKDATELIAEIKEQRKFRNKDLDF